MTRITYVYGGPMSFVLPDPPNGDELREAVHASLGLLDAVPATIGVALLAMAYRAPLTHIDFSGFLVGPTGVGKSELASLAQQHYGAGMDRLHLPASWSSTAEVLQTLAYQAKDALLVIDDFCPIGSEGEVARKHHEAKLLLSGHDAVYARRRKPANARRRAPMRPRALILVTGEELPRVQSLRGRTVVLDVGPRDLIWPLMSTLQEQARRGLFAAAMAGYIQWLATDFEARVGGVDTYVQGLGRFAASSRPDLHMSRMIVSLAAGMNRFLEFALDRGAIDARHHGELFERTWSALFELEADQARYFDVDMGQKD